MKLKKKQLSGILSNVQPREGDKISHRLSLSKSSPVVIATASFGIAVAFWLFLLLRFYALKTGIGSLPAWDMEVTGSVF